MSTFLGEFIGTMLLIIFGDGVVGGVVLNQSKAQNSGWIVITIAWGLAVTLAIYAVGSISGAHINPAVTIAMAVDGSFEWAKVPSYIIAQMLGAMAGAAIVWLHYLPHWSKTESPEDKLAVFATGPAIRSPWSNLLSEVIGTFILVAGLLFIGANKFTEGLNPLVVGLLIVAIGMSLGGTTGYAINPARDLGPRIAHFLLPIKGKGSSDWGYAAIPVLGPIIGGVFGVYFYKAVFQSEIGMGFWVSVLVVVAVVGMAVKEEMGK
ncbi:MAG TPA: aquaporin family protein [Bacteroidetes bacterium]|nr:aquaporin family protein [Bacteroidota bacterium]